MEKFENLGLTFLRPVAKEGNDSIKTALYDTNNLVYKYGKQFCDPTTCKDVINNLTRIGVDLKNHEATQRCEPKKREVLTYLRTVITSLKSYLAQHPTLTQADKEDVWKTVRYYTAQYVKAKGALTPHQMIDFLEEYNRIWYNQVQFFPNEWNLTQFKAIPEELLKRLNHKYNPYGMEDYLEKSGR